MQQANEEYIAALNRASMLAFSDPFENQVNTLPRQRTYMLRYRRSFEKCLTSLNLNCLILSLVKSFYLSYYASLCWVNNAFSDSAENKYNPSQCSTLHIL